MKRKTLGFLALSVSALLVLQTPATAMAGVWVNNNNASVEIPENHEYSGNVTVDGYEDGAVGANEDGDSLKIDGTVTSKDEHRNSGNFYSDTVVASNNAKVTITKDVSADKSNAVIANIDPESDNNATSGGKVDIGGNVSSAEGSAAIADGSGSSITINGDATSESGLAVGAFGGGSVTVGGDVKSNSTEEPAISADNGTVDIKGNVSGVNGGIDSSNLSEVKVANEVNSSAGVAINADSSAVTVGGNVSSSSDVAIIANNSSAVTVGGDVTGGTFKGENEEDLSTAIDMDSTSTVVVKGNVETANKNINNETAIVINQVNGNKGALIVLGDVTAHGEYGNAIWINTYNEENNTNDTFELDNLPDIVVGSLIADNEDLLVGFEFNNGKSEDENGALLESIYDNIMYYINIEQPQGGTINVTSGAEKYNDQYLVAHEDGSVSFSVTPDEGYELDSVAGGKVDIIKNADGTYTVVVPRGGGIKISALLKAIEKVIPSTPESPVIKVESSGSSSSKSDSDSAPVQTAAKSYSVFNNTIQKDIASVPQNGTMKIDMGNWISFNKKTFELLSKRSDVAITITYKYNGQTYRVTIPAGYPIMDLLDENGYCGCLYLNSIFGSELVTK